MDTELVKPAIWLHHEQMLIEAMTLMSKTGEQKLFVYNDQVCLGSISRDEIVNFLNQDQENKLSAYKLCFTIETLMALKPQKHP